MVGVNKGPLVLQQSISWRLKRSKRFIELVTDFINVKDLNFDQIVGLFIVYISELKIVDFISFSFYFLFIFSFQT